MLPLAETFSGNKVCCACVNVTVKAGVVLVLLTFAFSASPKRGTNMSKGSVSSRNLFSKILVPKTLFFNICDENNLLEYGMVDLMELN
jgi:hypothetical protein